MKALRATVAILAVAAPTGCDYESPGAVADESVWSAVPADSSEQGLPEREGRLGDVAELEDRAAGLQTRLDRVAIRLASEPEPTPRSEPRVSDLSAKLEAAKGELRELRGLIEDGESVDQRQERVEAQLDDVETQLSKLEQRPDG